MPTQTQTHSHLASGRHIGFFSRKCIFRHLRTCCIPALNNNNTDFVRLNTHSNTDSNTQTNVSSGQVTTGTIPYIRGTSETITRILQPYMQYTCCTQKDNHFTTTTY